MSTIVNIRYLVKCGREQPNIKLILIIILEINLLIKSKVVSMIAPHQTNIFFSVKTRNKLIWSLHPRAISTSIENNSRVTLIELKNT